MFPFKQKTFEVLNNYEHVTDFYMTPESCLVVDQPGPIPD